MTCFSLKCSVNFPLQTSIKNSWYFLISFHNQNHKVHQKVIGDRSINASSMMPQGYVIGLSTSCKVILVAFTSPRPNFLNIDRGINMMLAPKSWDLYGYGTNGFKIGGLFGNEIELGLGAFFVAFASVLCSSPNFSSIWFELGVDFTASLTLLSSISLPFSMWWCCNAFLGLPLCHWKIFLLLWVNCSC